MKHAVAAGAACVAAATDATRIDDSATERGLEGTRRERDCGFKKRNIEGDLLGTPSQPVQVELFPPHTPHASSVRLALTVNEETLLRAVFAPPAVSAM